MKDKIERAYQGYMRGKQRREFQDQLRARQRERQAREERKKQARERRAGRASAAEEGTAAATTAVSTAAAHESGFVEGTVVATAPRECLVLPDSASSRPDHSPDAVNGTAGGPEDDRGTAGSAEIRCTLERDLRERQQSEVAVGDRVVVELRSSGHGVVRLVHEPTTVLTRPDPLIPERVRRLAANVDVVTIVVSVVAPPLRIRLIDRMLIAVQRGGAEPLLVVNKIDLLSVEEAAALDERLAPYRRLGLRIQRVSAATGEGLDELRAALRGRTALFCGHSGVGKSSLLNTLHPGLRIVTAAVSALSAKGTHTTTSSRLYFLPEGTRIIDSPGIRHFGLGKIDRRILGWYFPEFEPVRTGCRYANCVHDQEPDCAVRAAAGDGTIPEARYETYLRILGSL